MKQPHKHAEVIKAWADGANVQYFDGITEDWHFVASPSWSLKESYRIEPKRETPKSTLSYESICAIWNKANQPPGCNEFESTVTRALRSAADAAVREFITSGEMVKYFMNPINGFITEGNV